MATYKPLESVTLTADTSSILLSGLDQTYTDLRVVISGTLTSNNQNYRFQFNTDSSSGLYSYTSMGATVGGQGSYRQSGINQINTFILNGTLTTSISTVTIDIESYADTNTSKSFLIRSNDGNSETQLIGGLWRSSAAINSITIFASAGSLAAGTTISVYGIKAGTPKAIGGDITTTDGTYWYHAFKNSGTFTVQQGSAITAEVLTVAGGGAGFYGGGGAGGVLYTSSQSFLPTSSYAITVGAGGATPNPNTGDRPVNGSDSLVTGGVGVSLRAYGGGGGGVYPTLPLGATGANGGSGGGAGVGTSGSPTQTGGSPTGGQGFRGGNTNSTNSAAGGGGAGAAGTDMPSLTSSGTNGGAGTNAYSTWMTATGLGSGGYIAAGGGGRGFDTRGTGGAGGGGSGDRANVSQGSAGTANTGSGGGGGYSFSPNGYAGGSGVVIVRYAV